MSDKSVATSVDVLTAAERGLVVEGLQLRVAQIRRSINAERDEAILAVRNKQLAAVEALVSKFR